MDMNLQPEALGALFEMSSNAVLGIDGDQNIIFANPAATALLGVLPGVSAKTVLPEYVLENPSTRFIASVNAGGQSANVSVTRLADCAVVTFSPLSTGAPVKSPISLLALKDMSNALMSTRLALDALVAHTKADTDPDLQDAVRLLYRDHYLMLRSSQHMNMAINIMQGTLPFSPKLTDLNELCRDLCQTLEQPAGDMGITVCFHSDGTRHLTMADSNLLEIMLFNLMANSMAHPGEGRTIDLYLKRQGEHFIITVEDKGSGISPEKMSGIFSRSPLLDLSDPNAGAGLGIILARGIAERHEGALIMASQENKGTAVSISLPCKHPDVMEINAPVTRYRSGGMNNMLTELSVLLDKKYYNRRMFD